MDNLVWRTRENIVAVVDLVIHFGCMYPVTVVIISMCTATEHRDGSHQTKLTSREKFANKDSSSYSIGLIIVVIALAVLFLGTQIIADIKLLQTTGLKIQPEVALRIARIWTMSTTMIFVVFMMLCFASLAWPWLAGTVMVMYRAPGIYIVTRFIEELECGATSRPESQDIVAIISTV